MRNKITILLMSAFAFVLITGLNGQEKKPYPYADEGLEQKTGRRILKNSWDKITKGDNVDRSDKIIIGVVKEIQETPDDDYYYHKATIAVETTLMGDTTEKEVIVKYIHPVNMSPVRFLRGRNWESHVKHFFKVEPEKYKSDLLNGKIGTPGQNTTMSTTFLKDEKVLVYISKIPFDIHFYYDGVYDKESGLYRAAPLADFFPYGDDKFYELQVCDGYYEVINKYTINEKENTIGTPEKGKKHIYNYKEFIRDLRKRVSKGQSNEK